MKTKFGETIQKLRKEQKMTLQELSKKSNISIVSLNYYENGKCLPKARTVYKLALALNYDFDELLELTK